MILLVTIIAQAAQYDLHLCITIAVCYFAASTASFAEENHMRNAHSAKQITYQNSRELSVKICQVSFVYHADMHVCMHACTARVTFMYHLISSLPAH